MNPFATGGGGDTLCRINAAGKLGCHRMLLQPVSVNICYRKQELNCASAISVRNGMVFPPFEQGFEMARMASKGCSDEHTGLRLLAVDCFVPGKG
ncbi:MAG TPA: hypothetical protein VIJ35_03620, partial [Bradyrhizobium sp.]